MWQESDFSDLIKWAKAQLNIRSVKITWKFLDREYVSGTDVADVIVDVENRKATIRIAASNRYDKEFTANSILHELRHVWQEIKGIMVDKWHHGRELDTPQVRYNRYGHPKVVYYGNSYWTHIWKGTEFAEALTWSRKEYIERPNEIDASEWANHALNLFYGTSHTVNRITRKLVAQSGGMKVYKVAKKEGK